MALYGIYRTGKPQKGEVGGASLGRGWGLATHRHRGLLGRWQRSETRLWDGCPTRTLPKILNYTFKTSKCYGM